MFASGNFYGRDVITALPNDKLMITNLRLSNEHGGEVYQFLRNEASKRFGYNSDNDVVNYMLAGEIQSADEVKNEWILFAADDHTIRSHIDILESAQLRPVSIDAIPCALFRNYRKHLRRQQDKERTEFFVDIGSRSTTVVFGRAGKIRFIKQIAIGGDNFNKQIAERLNVDIKEVENLRKTLRKEKLIDVNINSVFSGSDPTPKSVSTIPSRKWNAMSAKPIGIITTITHVGTFKKRMLPPIFSAMTKA